MLTNVSEATLPAINLVDADAAPKLEFLFEARIWLHARALEIGDVPEGHRTIYYVKGGTFEGPDMRGEVVPDSGADWVRQGADGTAHLDVRLCFKTDDGALLYVSWQGLLWAEPENAEYAFDLDKPDDPAGTGRFYYRAAARFETAHPRYAWLNKTLAVTKARLGDGDAIHRVFIMK